VLREHGVRIVGSALADTVLRQGPANYYGLTDAMKTVDQWREVPLSRIDDIAADGQEFDLGGIVVRAIHTPGHSPDSVCYLASMPDGRGDLFSGDTVFYKGFISLLAPPFNDLAHYPKGIAALSGLKVDGLFPGHLMWVLSGGQQYIDIAHRAFSSNSMPVPKPFS
jgi:glyoxylase-like metal-dependent hydrolase (beta-lactamase superfamily II)